MDGCTTINFLKTCQICFVLVGVVCGAWWHLRELSQQSDNSCIRTALRDYDKTWTRTVLTCFTKMIAEQSFLTQYERSMYHYERKINMLSSKLRTILWFFFLLLRDLGLSLGIFFKTHTLYRWATSQQKTIETRIYCFVVVVVVVDWTI